MLRLVNAFDPLVCVDLHATNGAKFEHDIAIMVQPVHAGDETLRSAGRQLRDAVIADLARQGSAPLPFYPSFVVSDDPASGVNDGVPPAALSHGYFHLRNRLGMLVETHSWKDYPTRVRITRNTVVSVLAQVAEHGRDWRRLAGEADMRAARLGGELVPLGYKATQATRIIDFKGYEYVRTPSDVSGALMTRYDESRPQVWKVPLRDEVLADVVVVAPRAGYVVPAAHARAVARRLDHHAVAYRTLHAPMKDAAVEAFRADKVTFAARPVENRQRVTLEGEWRTERRDIGAGALFVPIAQAKARLVIALLEPRSWDSLAAWGYFNAAFEKKEYMENYVAEEVAREQLASDPAVAAQFRQRLADDPEFARSAASRLEFFHRRHPSWDERLDLYPVLRTATVPR